jgi:putative DNA methylase
VNSIPRECKRLAEVDFPIAEVSRHSAREKSIRHGHPSTLHLWWARRPLASSRAMLLALLLPDPCDPACPSEFKTRARASLPKTLAELGPSDLELRFALLSFIADFANWDNSAVPAYTNAARSLVRAAYGDETPLVVDPFSGGGSIPLEALRLGCEVFASDLNPVSCLILKTLLEDIPRRGPELAQELRRVGEEVRVSAEKKLTELYPPDPDGARTVAYLWARTVRCEAPNCGAEIPLARGFWLANKKNKQRALRYTVIRPVGLPVIQFEVFEPKNESDVPRGSVSRAKAICLACGVTLPPDRVRGQLLTQQGGAELILDDNGRRIGGATLLATVILPRGGSGKEYRIAGPGDYIAVHHAQKRLRQMQSRPGAFSFVPDEPTPAGGGSGAGRAFSIQKYGMMRFGDLFTARQNLVLGTLSDLVAEARCSDETREILALAISRFADDYSALARWMTRETGAPTFARHALPIIWDFCEINPFDDSSWCLEGSLSWVTLAVESSLSLAGFSNSAHVRQADAREELLPSGSASVWFTDPPYYDAVPYSDLSDFFFTRLKRCLPNHQLLRDPYDQRNPLTPKDREVVQDDGRLVAGRPKDRGFFEEAMAEAFATGRGVIADEGIACVIFAHKTTEGWESLLSGMVRSGWVITASWPIATERPGRPRAHDSAALATSVHLVCRPRTEQSVGDWSDVMRELPIRVRSLLDRLSKEGVRGADLVFACIGPAMEVYSRYSKVVDAQDREIPLGGDAAAHEPFKQGFLAKVWEVVGHLALEQILGSVKDGPTSLEEDARLTALFLWTIQSSASEQEGVSMPSPGIVVEDDGDDEDQPVAGGLMGYSLPHDVVRRFAQPLGIHLETWEGRIIKTEKGVVQLLPIEDRAVQLFGQENIVAASSGWQESVSQKGRQLSLFPDESAVPAVGPTKRGAKRSKRVSLTTEGGVESDSRRKTTLDRLHTAMLLQSNGATAALKTFLEEEHSRGPDLERLANALAALYPRGSEERRLVEALTLAFPR